MPTEKYRRAVCPALVGLVICAVAALAGCVRTVVKDPSFDSPDRQTVFKKVEGCKLSLECLSPSRTFYAGQAAVLTFGLRNNGSKTVTILEWKKDERDNIAIHHVPYEEGQTRPPESGWTTRKSNADETVRRAALDLAPGNKVLVDVDLGFVGELSCADGKTKSFWVYGSLDLTSVTANSQVMLMRVKP